MTRFYRVFASLFWISINAWAGPVSFNYQGILYDVDGLPINTGTLPVLFQIYDPNLNCLLFEESHSIDMSGRQGLVSLSVGNGTQNISTAPSLTLQQVMSNQQTISTANMGCASFVPASTSARILRVTVDGETLSPDHSLNATPYALVANEAETLQGRDASGFVQIENNISQPNMNDFFDAVAALADGEALRWNSAGGGWESFETSTVGSTNFTNFSSVGIDDNADALAITIDSDEFVGIGTTSPGSLLDVNGSANINGTLTVNGVISGLSDPVAATDAATRQWVSSQISASGGGDFLADGSIAMTGAINMSGAGGPYKITGVGTPTVSSDAATKGYVDGRTWVLADISDAGSMAAQNTASYYTSSDLSTDTSATVHWNNLSNIPAGIADGDDDTTYSPATTTVDGLMSSADKTKLDAIDASATDDQTPAEIRTALLTVDGSSSGLDADVLDGQEGSYYLDFDNFSNVPAGIADGDDDTQLTESEVETFITNGVPDGISITGSADEVQLSARAFTGQSSNLFELRDSSGTVRGSFQADGTVSASTDLVTKGWVDAQGFGAGTGDMTEVTTSAASGLTGGSTSGAAALSVNIAGTTAETTVAGDDEILIYDTSAGGLRRMDQSDFVSSIDFNDLSNLPAGLADGDDDTTYSVATTGADGLMSSADKTKVDGIEAGATADQTPTEIRTALLTVDGASSGLDADILDGQEGSYYLNFNNFSNIPAGIADGDDDTQLTESEVETFIANGFPDGLSITGSADEVQLSTRAFTGQSSNLVEWQDSTGTVRASFQADGTISAATDLVTKGWVDAQGFGAGSGDMTEVTTSATSGLTGGATSGAAALSVNISGTTEETTVAADDEILIYDTSAGGLRRMDQSDFVSSIDFNDLSNIPTGIADGDDDTTYSAATTSVDGLMSAADKTKLDGIDASAADDQTPTEIRTALLTVDGAASGLDADLLDGQQGSYYLDFNNFSNLPAGIADGDDDTTYSAATTSVDGLMSSADKTKLDGIDASAADDQTPTEIRTALLTVDGAASGLDADLLDGQQGSYYLDFNNFSNLPAGIADGDDDTTYSAATTSVDGLMSAADKTKLDGIDASAADDQTPTEIRTALLTVDGAASGLDADLLDGQQGSYYLDFNNFSNLPAGIADGDDDTQLTESEVETFITNGVSDGVSITGSADEVQLSARAFAGQSSNLFELRDSGGTVRGSFQADGTVSASTDLVTKGWVDAQGFGAGSGDMTEVTTSATSGLTGGATSGAAALSVNISGTTEETTIAGNDEVLIFDASAGALRRMDQSDFVASIDFNDLSNVPAGIADGDDDTTYSPATITVDGLMSSSDKTKVDGIESGATADQTPTEIRTALLTVDGASSGLDADLLDGQEGSYYLNYNNLSNQPTIPDGNSLDGASGGPSNALVVDNAGDVGIGTSSPRAGLDVSNGAAVTKAATLNSTTTIDFGTGNIQYTNADCGSFTLHNLVDGGSYVFVVKGATSDTCAFTSYSDAGTTGITTHLPSDHAATEAGKHTIYNFMVVGTDVYVSFKTGF